MKVIGETFFVKKGAEGARYEAYLNSQAKGLLPDRTLESFYYLETPKVQFPIIGNFFWVERQSQVVSYLKEKSLRSKDRARKIINIFLFCLFYLPKK